MNCIRRENDLIFEEYRGSFVTNDGDISIDELSYFEEVIDDTTELVKRIRSLKKSRPLKAGEVYNKLAAKYPDQVKAAVKFAMNNKEDHSNGNKEDYSNSNNNRNVIAALKRINSSLPVRREGDVIIVGDINQDASILYDMLRVNVTPFTTLFKSTQDDIDNLEDFDEQVVKRLDNIIKSYGWRVVDRDGGGQGDGYGSVEFILAQQ